MKVLFKALMGLFLCHTVSATWQPLKGTLYYDRACYLTAHNAYASYAAGYAYAQQRLSIKDQLSYGVRAFMLDTYIEHGVVVLCHKGPRISRLLCRGKDPEKLIDTLALLKRFLDENPTEVVTLFLETYAQRAPEVVDAPFIQAELHDYILKPGDWNDAQHQWPRLAWMRTHNKRLVLFNTQCATRLCHNQWQHVVENQWGTTHPAKACKERPQSYAYKDQQRSLYLLNFFPMLQMNVGTIYQQINTKDLDAFLARVLKKGLTSGSNKRLLPTFLCLDFVDTGAGLEHVMAFNKRAHE